jgi:hypothetical protein
VACVLQNLELSENWKTCRRSKQDCSDMGTLQRLRVRPAEDSVRTVGTAVAVSEGSLALPLAVVLPLGIFVVSSEDGNRICFRNAVI